jgi:hypothetical protein
MAKTDPKQQLKWPNSANFKDTTEIIMSTPTTMPTHDMFPDFIKLANINTIITFLTETTYTLES